MTSSAQTSTELLYFNQARPHQDIGQRVPAVRCPPPTKLSKSTQAREIFRRDITGLTAVAPSPVVVQPAMTHGVQQRTLFAIPVVSEALTPATYWPSPQVAL